MKIIAFIIAALCIAGGGVFLHIGSSEQELENPGAAKMAYYIAAAFFVVAFTILIIVDLSIYWNHG